MQLVNVIIKQSGKVGNLEYEKQELHTKVNTLKTATAGLSKEVSHLWRVT
jgi:hypothetical protein